MTQPEFDSIDAVVIHLSDDSVDPPVAFCSGIEIGQQDSGGRMTKQCQACRYLALRKMRRLYDEMKENDELNPPDPTTQK